MGKLTAAKVRGLKVQGRYLDGDGLSLIIDQAGRRYWGYRFMRQGRSRTMGLGNADAITLAEARQRHADARALVLRHMDPLDQRQASRASQAPARARSFAQAVEAFIRDHRAGWRGPRLEEQWRNSLRDYAAMLDPLPVGDIGTEQVLGVLRPIWAAKPETASRLRSRIEAILAYAIAHGWRPGPNPAMWRGGLKPLLAAPAKLRTATHYAALPWARAPAFMRKLRAVESMHALALQFVILTGARSGEVRGMKWSEVDWDTATWTVPANRMKAGKEHRVPLSEPALELLRRLRAIRFSDHVFPNRSGGPLVDCTLLRVIRELGEETVVVHGFRSCFRDWAADNGKSADAAEAALAHARGNAVVQAYARSDLLEQRRPLMQQWARYLVPTEAVVVPISVAA
jgi:integrase